MSRSYKRVPVTGYSFAESEKNDKRRANRSLRRATHSGIQTLGADTDTTRLPVIREVSNRATFDKDGRQWLDTPEPSDYRK